MRIASANEIVESGFYRAGARSRGVTPELLRVLGARSVEMQVTSMHELPCLVTPDLQTALGALYWVVGFSSLGGGDVLL